MEGNEIYGALFCPYIKESALFSQYRTLPLFSTLGMSKIYGMLWYLEMYFLLLFGDWGNLFFEKNFFKII